MNEDMEYQGKTVEEAVSEALLQLGARKDEVDVKILDEGKSGFLGMIGAKPARVLVRRKQRTRGRRQRAGGARARDGHAPRKPGQKTPTKQTSQRSDGPSRAKTAARVSSEAPKKTPPGSSTLHTGNAPTVPLGDPVQATDKAAPLRGMKPEEAVENLEKITSHLMQLSGFPCRCEVQEGEYHLVKIITDDASAGMLIGRHGTTVDAVEHLVERMASQAVGERVNMNLDVNNYRRRREESLVQRVHDIMQKVQSTGREIHMEPLCARERRIVHLEVVKDEGLRTYTIATSSGKHVVVARGGLEQEATAGQDTSEHQAERRPSDAALFGDENLESDPAAVDD
jgi:spoIIIJ-associated protein